MRLVTVNRNVSPAASLAAVFFVMVSSLMSPNTNKASPLFWVVYEVPSTVHTGVLAALTTW